LVVQPVARHYTDCTILAPNESWAVRKTDERRLKSAEIRFMRTAGYTLLESRINEEIVREIQSPQILGFIEQQRRNSLIMR
jgi:hypothetical protein